MTGSALAVVRARGDRVNVELLAREAGLHPDLVVRLIRLGVLDGPASPNGGIGVAGAAARLARVARLRRDLGVNVAGAVLANQLLARIDELELRLERYETTPRGVEVMTWIRTD
jgi:hypothetical protein